ncbi:MAG: alpha-2-macroglobulin, partial [Prevotellaceae bacterium]|nr:alpha-2-macroglobulin [Prevotellaceae bacterium]
RKRQPDRTLRLQWQTFRDRLRPGDSEEWKLTVQTPQGLPAQAELLALLYDASLDRLYQRSQRLHAQPLFYQPYRSRGWARASYIVFRPTFPIKTAQVMEWLFDHLYEAPSSTMRHLWGNVRLAATGAALSKSAGMVVDEETAVETASAAASDAEPDDMGGVETSAEEASTGLLRKDFSETAFFYPHLRTDAQGEVILAFTLPQSLTRWNFRSYAHTREMLTGSLDTTVVAAKEFMLTPDMPRFVRVGDRTVIAATVDNLTERAVEGTATLTLFNPVTEQTLATLNTSFSVEAGRRATVSFPFTVTDSCSVIGVRIVADGGTFSDGEQHLLAVLDNRTFITETVPLPVRGGDTRTFSLDSLFNHHSPAATHRRLTLEFTANPAWYALFALPSLLRPATQNALTLAAAYYADCVAGYIAGSYPRLQTMVDVWQKSPEAKAAFTSPLARNQTLKELLLDESPWVAAADNESERMAALATLFNTNDRTGRLSATLTLLNDLQAADGSWSWYKGMAGSRSITTYVARLLLRLPLLTGTPLEGDALSMQRKAMDYLHRQALEEYLSIKKQEGKARPSTLSQAATAYLYLVALSGEAVPKAYEEAYRYYMSLLPNHLSGGSVAGKAQAAFILQRAGRGQEAAAFTASLREYLVKEDEQGTHFAQLDLPYAGSGRILSAHVAAMEAFTAVGGADSTVEEMKQWLLKQKQAGAWNSTVATADAIYALLCRGDNPLEGQGAASISLDNHTVATLPADASLPGAGYVKRQYEEGSAEVNARTVTVKKEDGGTAWGALYAQYLIPMRDVNEQGTALGIERRLYVERLAANGQSTLQPVTPDTPLSIGDKVISRLVLRVDRAMDFVQLKARHAACLEPVNTLSGYRGGSGLSYYMEVDDASTNCYFDHLGKGTYVVELPFRIDRAGVYEAGTATLQCAYAPEFAAHSDSEILTVE